MVCAIRLILESLMKLGGFSSLNGSGVVDLRLQICGPYEVSFQCLQAVTAGWEILGTMTVVGTVQGVW